jgi:hypothetical protein
MLLTIAELRRFVETDEEDQVLEAKLQALELMIRAYTNNNFQARAFRAVAVSLSEDNTLLVNTVVPFAVGDTLQISGSDLQDGALVTVSAIEDGTIYVNEDLLDESGVVITKVKYPMDVKMGAVNLLKWELNNRDKVGVSSETISRHSVTYFNMDGDNSIMGYPRSLLGFLKPHKKARFGQGVRA